jgi:hypothetical protein
MKRSKKSQALRMTVLLGDGFVGVEKHPVRCTENRKRSKSHRLSAEAAGFDFLALPVILGIFSLDQVPAMGP